MPVEAANLLVHAANSGQPTRKLTQLFVEELGACYASLAVLLPNSDTLALMGNMATYGRCNMVLLRKSLEIGEVAEARDGSGSCTVDIDDACGNGRERAPGHLRLAWESGVRSILLCVPLPPFIPGSSAQGVLSIGWSSHMNPDLLQGRIQRISAITDALNRISNLASSPCPPPPAESAAAPSPGSHIQDTASSFSPAAASQPCRPASAPNGSYREPAGKLHPKTTPNADAANGMYWGVSQSEATSSPGGPGGLGHVDHMGPGDALDYAAVERLYRVNSRACKRRRGGRSAAFLAKRVRSLGKTRAGKESGTGGSGSAVSSRAGSPGRVGYSAGTRRSLPATSLVWWACCGLLALPLVHLLLSGQTVHLSPHSLLL